MKTFRSAVAELIDGLKSGTIVLGKEVTGMENWEPDQLLDYPHKGSEQTQIILSRGAFAEIRRRLHRLDLLEKVMKL